ncbi:MULTISPECIES: hypothetical protein [Bacillus]|uniref:Uncharacterized protein n=1 Tax=Bacillus infantis TaxID=324767 RepID=A0A5D4RD40_9BACI|nr:MULTISPECIES: hypothetical protein [Bacillus]PLR71164.1 hypothetical protein CYJ37_20530 [Bacillus sp. UMB0728]TYS48569.1 hypothetical protein FZD51_10630 [Bacillus infantis]
MEQRLLTFGYILFFSGIVLFGFMHLAIAAYMPHLTGWSNPPGKLASVLTDIAGWVPYVLSIALIAAGILIVIYHLFFFKKGD